MTVAMGGEDTPAAVNFLLRAQACF